MKNLKRALSLVLSTAMLAGMMMVGTGAAFADVTAEHNEEAIAVVSAAGIMGANEEFNPDANITRNEMAVVMVNMLGLDTDDYAGASNFTDVPAWAADYVDACYANGIVSGTSATTYNGSANVTTAEAALMMLKALGYFEEKAINDWMLDTIKTASKIDLLDDIDAKATAKLTRNEVAQLALNALETEWVTEIANGSNTSIKGENIEITVDSSVYTEKSGELLLNKLFDDRFEKNEEGYTKLGLPAVVWYDNDEKETIIRAAKEADEVVIAAKTTTAEALYLDKVDEDFEESMSELDVIAGDVVYYYENDDKSIDAYSVRYELVQVTDIDDDMKKAEIEDGHEFEVELNDGDYYIYDDNFAGYDYEEDDYVLVVINEDEDEVLASELATIVEGKIKSVTSKGKLNIDGKSYTNKSETELGYGDEVVAVLNKAGQIILVDELNAAVKSEDVAYIYNVVENEGDKNDDGVAADGTYTAYVVLADGTKAKYVIEEDSVEAAAEGAVVAYSINKDDELEVEASNYVIAAVKGDLSKDAKSVATNDGKVYGTSKTEFVFAAWDDDKMVVTTNTGIKNVEIENADMFVVYDDEDLEALTVFVLAEDDGIESDAQYAVMIDNNYTYTEDDDDNTYYTYTVFVNGDEADMTFETAVDLEEGEVFAYIMDGDYAVVSAAEYELVEGTVTYEGEDFIEIDGVEYTVADDVEIVTVTTVLDADGEYDYTEAKDAGKIEKDVEMLFYANSDDEIEIVFIIEVDD